MKKQMENESRKERRDYGVEKLKTRNLLDDTQNKHEEEEKRINYLVEEGGRNHVEEEKKIA